MNRTFQAKSGFYAWLLVALTAIVAFLSLWYKNPFVALIALVLLGIIVERIIHTVYTLTEDGFLIIHKGRFVKEQRIALKAISSVEGCRSFNIGRYHLLEYLLIHYGDNNETVSLMPLQSDEFMKYLEKKRRTIE